MYVLFIVVHMQIAAQCPVDELQEEDLAAAILIYETMW
jgi:hypothetical protein